MSEKLWHLRSCTLFQELSSEQLSRLESRSRLRCFAAHQPIYLPSEAADTVCLLTAGLVKVCHLTADGQESILAFVEPGTLFGEVALLEADQRDEYVESIERSSVVMISAAEIIRLMNERSDVAVRVTRLIGLRRHRIERRLRNQLFLCNRDRLQHLLLDLAEQFGSQRDGGIHLGIRLSHQELASVIGSTRETVTVLLVQLRSEGLITIGRRRLFLADPERLAQGVQRRLGSGSGPMTPSPAILAVIG